MWGKDFPVSNVGESSFNAYTASGFIAIGDKKLHGEWASSCPRRPPRAIGVPVSKLADSARWWERLVAIALPILMVGLGYSIMRTS
jgi:hypothetical protein